MIFKSTKQRYFVQKQLPEQCVKFVQKCFSFFVFLVSLLLTLKIFMHYSCISIVGFEQVNTSCGCKKYVESWNGFPCSLLCDLQTYQVSPILLILPRIVFSFSVSRPYLEKSAVFSSNFTHPTAKLKPPLIKESGS